MSLITSLLRLARISFQLSLKRNVFISLIHHCLAIERDCDRFRRFVVIFTRLQEKEAFNSTGFFSSYNWFSLIPTNHLISNNQALIFITQQWKGVTLKSELLLLLLLAHSDPAASWTLASLRCFHCSLSTASKDQTFKNSSSLDS